MPQTDTQGRADIRISMSQALYDAIAKAAAAEQRRVIDWVRLTLERAVLPPAPGEVAPTTTPAVSDPASYVPPYYRQYGNTPEEVHAELTRRANRGSQKHRMVKGGKPKTSKRKA